MSDQLTPAADLAEVAEYAAQSETGAIVLEETIRSGLDGQLKEAGRTWCSGDDKGDYRDAIERLPAAIELAGCPPGDVTVTWHTHTTRDQLFNPEHSLPDVANVAFGAVDISIIPGIETDHILVGSADRERMADELQLTTGIEMDSPSDVTDAIASGEITNPPELRDRLYDQFDALEKRPVSNRDYLAPHVDAIFDGDLPVDETDVCEGLHTIECDPDTPGGDHVAPEDAPKPPTRLRANNTLRREARVSQYALADKLERFGIAETVVGTTVGMFTSRLLERAVFGE